jgi:hypothetical protein
MTFFYGIYICTLTIKKMIMSNSVWHYCRSICSATMQMEMHLYGGL